MHACGTRAHAFERGMIPIFVDLRIQNDSRNMVASEIGNIISHCDDPRGDYHSIGCFMYRIKHNPPIMLGLSILMDGVAALTSILYMFGPVGLAMAEVGGDILVHQPIGNKIKTRLMNPVRVVP